MPLSKVETAVSWVLQLVVAGILLQTLFFKFTGAAESVYIFGSVGRYLNLPAVEPWGRIGSGVVELIAAVLLLGPGTAPLGALLAMGVMAGAIASHLLILGIDVQSDGGLLFGLALTVLCGSLVVLILRRTELPVTRLFGLGSAQSSLESGGANGAVLPERCRYARERRKWPDR